MADFIGDQGAKVPTRSQTRRWCYVWNCREENKVSGTFSLVNPTPQLSDRELSQGHFSDDNQKKLTGTKTILPVYEAKMTGDTRLVVS